MYARKQAVDLDRVREGFAKKLAHLWHGPFRVIEMPDPFVCRLEIPGSEYRIFPLKIDWILMKHCCQVTAGILIQKSGSCRLDGRRV